MVNLCHWDSNVIARIIADESNDNLVNVELVNMRIYGHSPDEFRWAGYIKHTSVTFDTETLKIDVLKKILTRC
jgi:hypothetical protein